MKLLLDEHSAGELADLAGVATLVLPIGSTEQHGPHLPVSTDALCAQAVARAAASEATTPEHPVLVAPTLGYGVSDHHLPRGGTLSVTSGVYLAFLNDVLASAVRVGFRRIVLINGHGGNEDLARQAARDTTVEHPAVIAAAGYWTMAWPDLVGICQRYGLGALPGHAGAFEASLVSHLLDREIDVSGVRPSQRPEATSPEHPLSVPAVEVHGWVEAIDGHSDGATAVSAAAGAEIFDCVSRRTAQFLRDFARRPLPDPVHRSGRHGPAAAGHEGKDER